MSTLHFSPLRKLNGKTLWILNLKFILFTPENRYVPFLTFNLMTNKMFIMFYCISYFRSVSAIAQVRLWKEIESFLSFKSIGTDRGHYINYCIEGQCTRMTIKLLCSLKCLKCFEFNWFFTFLQHIRIRYLSIFSPLW